MSLFAILGLPLLRTLLFPTLVLCRATPSSVATRDACALPSRNGQSFGCTLLTFQSVPGGSTVGVYQADDVPVTSKYPPFIAGTTANVMSTYKDFLAGKSIKIVFYAVSSVTSVDDANAAASFFSPDLCTVEIAAIDSASPDESAFNRTVAHELYHCVQQALGQKAPSDEAHDAAKWWKEGTATYFSDDLYPPTSSSYKEAINLYNPNLPLYQADVDGDSAALFFQFLSNSGWSDAEINGWMARQGFSTGAAAELSRIAADSEIAELFPKFAARYVDGQINYRGGVPVELSNPVQAKEFPVPVTNGALYDIPTSLGPWQIDHYATTTFQPDKTVSVTFTVDDPADSGATVVQYRRVGEQTWSVLDPGDVVDLQNTGSSSCPTGATQWAFLITSTFDTSKGSGLHSDALVHAKLSFSVSDPPKRRRRDDPSSCSDSTTCLVGNWTLDKDSMQSFLADRLASAPGGSQATITGLAVSGSSTFTVSRDLSAVLVDDGLHISYDGSAGGIDFHTDIDITATITGTLALATASSSSAAPTFSWANSTAIGTAKSTTTVLGTPVDFDFDLGQQYGDETIVQYNCSGDALSMIGYLDGKYVWAYTWLKA